MFNKLLVGIGSNEEGADSVTLARQLLATGGSLTLAYVYGGDPNVYRNASIEYEAAEREYGLKLLTKVRDEAKCDARLQFAQASSVGRGLHMLAEAIDADLLVVGSSRRALLGGVLLGDDTQAALNGAPCAIAIAPTGYAHEPAAMREIGVAYDGTAESEHALSLARALANERGAKLSAFEAVSLETNLLENAESPIDKSIDEAVERARERIAAQGDVEAHAAYGDPAEELALYSASLDLLVVGSRDYGPIGRLVHGSTSRDLARLARCPLLVLTRGARRRHGEPADAARRTPLH